MNSFESIILDDEKRLIKGIIKYENNEICKDATIVISMREIKLDNKEYITDIGYTISNEKGEFSFIVDFNKYRIVDYIIKVSNPLIKFS